MNNTQATIGKPSTESSPPGKRPRLSKMNSNKNNRTTKVVADSKPPMHSGRWTPEEEKYVEGMIAEFKAGLLPIAEGTTLRSFLAKMLSCSPKRVSKKWDSSKIYNGKLAYARAKMPLPLAEACARQENLLELERQFREALSTMQRVESRLKSLTATTETRYPVATALTPPPKPEQQTESSESGSGSGGMMPLMESWKSSSAASSLTADDDEDDAQVMVTLSPNIEEKSKTQVSWDGDSDLKPAAAVTVPRSQGSDEETAGKMLLKLSSCSRKRPASEACLDATFDGDVVLQKLHKSQARDEAAAQVKSLVLSTAPLSGATHQAATTSQESDANLQGLLHKLQELKQQQQQQQPASSNSNGLQEFLANPNAQQQTRRFGSPIDQPQNTRQSLQGFLQSLQQKSDHQEQQQQPQQQQQHTDLQGLLHMFQQQQRQNQYQQGGQQAHASSADQQPNLQSILQMVAQRQQSQQQNHQNPQHFAKVLQTLVETQQARQVSQQAMTSLQGLLQSLAAQQAARQQQHVNLDGVVTTLLDQLRDNVSSQIHEQVRNGSSAASSSGSSTNQNNSALEGLLQSLAANHTKQNQQAGPSASEPLQQLLLQFVQQNNNGDSSSFLSQLR